MNTHKIQLSSYCATGLGGPIYLGTAGSHGNERLKITRGEGWKDLAVQVIFYPCQVAVLLPADDILEVPWEATAVPLSTLEGRIVFQGFDQDRLVNSTDLHYTVSEHSITVGRDEKPYTPGIVEGVLNQMATDKAAILAAATTASHAKEEAAISASQAAAQAADACQNANMVQTIQTQVAASAAAAADHAAAASQTLQLVEDAGANALKQIIAASPALPAVSANAAWQAVTVKPDGTGYNLTGLAPLSAAICPTAIGNPADPAVCQNSTTWGFQGLKIYGKSIQNGIPSPQNPMHIICTGDEGNLGIEVNGVNLITFPYYDGNSKVSKGISYFVNNDTSITVTGTATEESSFNLCLKDFGTEITSSEMVSNGKYTVSGHTKNISIEYSEVSKLTFLKVEPGKTVNETIYPQINLGTTALPWKPCYTQTLSLSTPTGLPGIPVTNGGNYTDINGQQWICDCIDLGAGIKHVKIIKDVIDSVDRISSYNSHAFSKYVDANHFYSVPWTEKPLAMCSALPIVLFNNLQEGKDGISLVSASGSANWQYAMIITGIDQTLEAYNAYLSENPITIITIAGTATAQDVKLSAEEIAAYHALTTCDGTTVVSTPDDPSGLEVRYVADGTSYLQSMSDRITALEAI